MGHRGVAGRPPVLTHASDSTFSSVELAACVTIRYVQRAQARVDAAELSWRGFFEQGRMGAAELGETPDLRREDVFLTCFSRDRHRIYRFIFSLLLDENDAEEVFQQVSVELWKSFGGFDESREFLPWACTVAYRCVQRYRRTAAKRGVFLTDELIAVIADERIRTSNRSRHRLELLEECLALLGPRDRELVGMVYRDGESAGAVAERIGKAVQTIYNRLNLIRRNLLDCVNRKSAHA